MRLALQNSIPAFRRIAGGGGGNQVDLSAITDIIAFGDSYTDPGLQASPASNSYINRLITTTGKNLTNRGGTGTGIATALYASYTTGVLNRTQAITCMVGLNDSNRNGMGAAFVEFWKQYYRAFLCSLLVTSGQPAGNDAVVAYTVAGQWNKNYEPGANYTKSRQFGVANKKCALAQNPYPISGTMTYSFTNDHVVLGYLFNTTVSPAGVRLGEIEVRLDGVLVDTINQTDAPSQSLPGWESFADYNPRVKIYSGLANAAHTIEIRCLNMGGGGGAVVDYFGHFDTDVADTKPIILADVTYITNYAQTAPYDQGSTAAADALKNVITDLITEAQAVRPGLPIAHVFINTDEPLLVPGDYHADGLHWNNPGHGKGETKFLSHISGF